MSNVKKHEILSTKFETNHPPALLRKAKRAGKFKISMIQTGFRFWKLKVFVPYFAGAAFYIIIRFFVLDLGARGEYLGGSFFKQTVSALIVSFILMGLVVFFYFRTPMASLIVILAALSDIIVTLAIFNLTGIKLSSAGVAAFLMLIGYSVDTDILLSTRMLKRQNEGMMDRIYGALKTGATMTITTLAAVFVALVFAQNEIIKQIMIILFIGLLVDPIMTYIQNAGLLRMYLEKKTKTNEPR